MVNKIMTAINEHYNKGRAETFRRFYKDDYEVGQLVCARYSEDNRYYRAEILRIKEVGKFLCCNEGKRFL